MDIFLFLFIFLLATLNLVLSVKHRQFLQILPSFAWITLSVIPFIYSQNFFPDTTIFYQTVGIATIGIALLLGDLYSILFVISQKDYKNTNLNTLKLRYLFYILTGLLFLIPVVHIYLTGSIPLINKVFGDFTSLETSISREIYMKISIPYWFKVISNWCVTLIGPTLLTILIYKRKFWQAILIFAWTLFYAYSSTEKAPSVFLIISVILILAQFQKDSLRNFISVGILTIFGITIIMGTHYGNTMIKRSEECPTPVGVNLTPGNIARSCSNDNLITINPIVDRIGYRVFLTPIEVSNYWYQYYNFESHKKRSINELVSRNSKPQAANEVGIWAFQRSFPEKYLSTVSAYSSIDADAYSFGGIPAILFVSLILLLIRIYISRSKDPNNLYEKILNGLGTTFLLLFPFQASLQAMLIPQGLLVIILSIFILRNRKILTKLINK